MAGPYTHWMVAEAALGQEIRYARLNPGHPLATQVIQNMPLVAVGAVSPDMPNLAPGQAAWSDRMHYEAIGTFLYRAIGRLLRLRNAEPARFAPCLAWTMGFVAHVVADVVIHPVVNLVVGPYVLNQDEHRRCEMAQDAYIFRQVKGTELVDSRYCRILPQGDLGPVWGFWAEVLDENYPGKGKPDPASWYATYLGLLDVASAFGSNVPAVFRHAAGETGYCYRSTADFKRGGADDDFRYFTELRLPGTAARGGFDQVFERTVQKVVELWGDILADLEAGDPQRCLSYLKDWNLDLGVDQRELDLWA